MNINDKYDINTGKWNHTCLDCKKPFQGTEGKKYCSPKCKRHHDNEIIKTANRLINKDVITMRKNVVLLKSFVDKGITSMLLEDFKESGFIQNTSVKLYEEDGKEWRIIGDYGFCITKGRVEIKKF